MLFLRASLALLFLTFGAIAISAQQASPTATPPEDETVKITTALIQIDAVVTDKEGRPVKDLKPEDFTIYQDGKPQQITNLSFVDLQSRQRTTLAAKDKKRDKKDPLPPPAPLRSAKGRLITFVLDDGNCLLTADGMVRLKDGVKRFIRDQMQPDDLVAIYRTKGGASLLQAYTSRKEVLNRIVDKIPLIGSLTCGSAFDPVRDKGTFGREQNGAGGAKVGSFESESDAQFRKDNENRERENQVIGTIGVLNFVVERMKAIPQRKMIFLLSEGIMASFDSRTFDALRELADRASRASVAITAMSTKGLTIPGMIEAQDEVRPGILGSTDTISSTVEGRMNEERALNEGLGYLANATGGRFVRNKNYLHTEIEKILEEESGYYLIGYEPDDETFKGKEFHKIEIKLNRPDLKVSNRKGFYGRPDVTARQTYRSADSPLFEAISSPFMESGLDLRMTTQLAANETATYSVRSIVHVNGSDITMTDVGNGAKKTVLDVVAVLLDEKGKVAEEFNRSYPITIPAQGVPVVQRFGLEFMTDIPVHKKGIYSFRLAIRDVASKKLGAAGDFIEVPDLKSDRLFVSGLITSLVGNDGKHIVPKGRPADSAFAPVFTDSSPSVRQFQRGGAVPYVFAVNNPRTSKTGERQLTKEIRLFFNGENIATLDEKPLELTATQRPDIFQSDGFIKLANDVAPGDYVLQVIVRDKTSNQVSSQSIDFEVVD